MKFDELLFTHLGEFGKYQKIQFLLVCLPTIFTAMHALSWTFTAAHVNYRCRLPNESSMAPYWVNDSIHLITPKCELEGDQKRCPYDDCHWLDNKKKRYCNNGWIYDRSEITNSAISRWNIVCDDSVIKAVVQSSYYVGQMIGSIVFGYLGDRFGRKKVFFSAIILQIACGSLMSIVPFWPMFAIGRMGVGAAHPGIFMIAVVIGMELVGPSKRKMAGVISGMFFSVGQIILGLLSNFIRDYQVLQTAITLPAMVFIIYWWIVPESARWLVSQKRFQEADKVLQTAARINGAKLPEAWWEMIESPQNTTRSGAEKHYDFRDLVRTPRMRHRTLVAFFCWPVVSLVYYGVSMNSNFLGGNLYVNFIFGAAMEIPALFIVYMVIDRIGRKPLLAGGYFIASLCMLSNLLVSKDAPIWISITQFLLTKAAITGVYATIYTFTPELFPTAMGVCSMVARVGAITASFIAMWLVERYGKLLMVIPFGTLGVLAGFAALSLPETMGTNLPETIEEIESPGKSTTLPEAREMLPTKGTGDDKETVAIGEDDVS